MKSIFAHFKKSKRSSENSASPGNTSHDSERIHHNFGESASAALKKPRVLILIALFAVIAVGLWGYKYFNRQNGDVNIADIPKAKMYANTVHAAVQDPMENARQLYEDKEIQESIAVFRSILKKSPDDIRALNDLGMAYLKAKEFQQSEDNLRKSLKLDPKCVTCLNNLGYLKTLQGDPAIAEKLLKTAMALDSQYIDPYFNLGVLYEKNGDFSNSANAYREYIRRSNDPNTPFNLKLKQHIQALVEK